MGINNKKHRADIWSDYCGVPLKTHNVYLPYINMNEISNGRSILQQIRGNKSGPSVLFCPMAFDPLRSLTNEQIISTVLENDLRFIDDANFIKELHVIFKHPINQVHPQVAYDAKSQLCYAYAREIGKNIF